MQRACRFKIYAVLVFILVGQMFAVCRAQYEAEATSASNYLGYDDICREFKRGKCKSCHPAIWREWENSLHAKAWNDSVYQESASRIVDREKKCDPCHAPEPILITGLGKMPKLRETDRSFGVSCLVCHIDARGAMHGPPASTDALFHANVADERYANPTELCGTCHGQASVPQHNQLESFKGSPAEKSGKNCAHCHMPRVKRLQSTQSHSAISGRRHTWMGSRSLGMLQRAADLRITRENGIAVIYLTNRAGHILPGDALRVLTLDVRIFNSVQATVRESRLYISVSSGDEGSDNRLQAGETREFEYSLDTEDTIDVKLVYRLAVDAPESEWVTMIERSRALP